MIGLKAIFEISWHICPPGHERVNVKYGNKVYNNFKLFQNLALSKSIEASKCFIIT